MAMSARRNLGSRGSRLLRVLGHGALLLVADAKEVVHLFESDTCTVMLVNCLFQNPL